MEEANATTRERIAEYLRERTAAAGTIAAEFGVATDDTFTHIEHIAKSLDGTGEQLLVAPPECRDCGFAGFDNPANRPSRCPECRSEAIEEPRFRID